MDTFRKILFVSHGTDDDSDALKQALSIARNNNASLTLLVSTPALPSSMDPYRNAFELSLTGHVKDALDAAKQALNWDDNAQQTILLDSTTTPSLSVIQRVIRDGYDLLVKAPIPRESGKGFAAYDMDLLRKCPCPIWLCRPIGQSRDQIRVAVAIDPDAQRPTNISLSIRLLKLARKLADTCSGELKIITSWNHDYEGFLLHNRWAGVNPGQVQSIIETEQRNHRATLDNLIASSGITGSIEVHHVRGRPETTIPKLVESEGIDILAMGTVARTGIPGLIIGNTAENIVQNLGCSLLALKPETFVSPVTP